MTIRFHSIPPSDPRTLHILFVDDSAIDTELAVRELRHEGCVVEYDRVDCSDAMRSALAEKSWDVVLCDWTMPSFNAAAAFAILEGSGLDIPFIIVSGTIGEEMAVEAMRAGVNDFILKDKLGRLAPAIERALRDQKVRAALARGEKLRMLGEMAAGVSHDLKNVLNPLSLHVQVAARANDRGDAVAVGEALAAMTLALRRGLDVIERLRHFSRQSPDVRLVVVDLNMLTREAIHLAMPRLARGTALHEELGSAPPILGQPSEIVSALLNLLVNAVDAIHDRGVVTVRTGEEHGGSWIAVIDDGPGMSPEVQARAFEPFFTTKGTDGTGLGLATVYATMHRHGGNVRVDTKPDEGTTFTLWFPRLAPAPS